MGAQAPFFQPMSKEKLSIKGTLLVLFAAMLWGTTGTSQGLAPAGVSSSVIGTTRLLLGGLSLFTIHIIINGKKIYSNDNIDEENNSLKYIFCWVLGIITVATYQITFFYGVKMSGVAIGTVVAIGSSPLWAGILGYIFLNEKPFRIWYISTIMSVFGLFLLTINPGSTNLDFSIIGIILTLLAGLSYAIYALSAKILLKRYRPDFVMTIFFLGGGILLSPIIFFNDMKWIITIRGFVMVLHLGLFATALSYFLFSRGLKLIHVSKASTLSLAEPLTASILGVMVLGENLSFNNFLGIVIIFVSLLILSKN